MIALPNDNRCSQPVVFPKNWKTSGASCAVDWYINYYFYSDGKRKQISLRLGINKLKTVKERREFATTVIAELLADLKAGFNPVSNSYQTTGQDIEPTMPLPNALQFALDKKVLAPCTRADIKSCLLHTNKAITQLGYNNMQVVQVRRKHIRLVLDKVAELRVKFSPNRFNKYRSYLMILFDELAQLEAVEFNPVTGIKKQKEIRQIRLTLTAEERVKVNELLAAKYKTFHRLLHIFFHSGARETEIMKVQVKDVDLKKQQVTYTVLKGKQPTQVVRVIKTIVLPLWAAQVANQPPENYVFAKGLKPGPVAISSSQITKRWYRLVKKPLGIKADFYSLKHSNTDETAALLNIKDAAAHNSHKGAKITRLYAQGEDGRQMDRLKGLGNEF